MKCVKSTSTIAHDQGPLSDFRQRSLFEHLQQSTPLGSILNGHKAECFYYARLESHAQMCACWCWSFLDRPTYMIEVYGLNQWTLDFLCLNNPNQAEHKFYNTQNSWKKLGPFWSCLSHLWFHRRKLFLFRDGVFWALTIALLWGFTEKYILYSELKYSIPLKSHLNTPWGHWDEL